MVKFIYLLLLIQILTIPNPYPYCKPNERSDYGECVTLCEKNEYFNYLLNNCEKCKDDEIYNKNSKFCKPKCESDEIFNPDIKKCKKIEKNNCTENEDYDNIDKKCIKKDETKMCNPKMYYDEQLKRCIDPYFKECQKNYRWDNKKKTCLKYKNCPKTSYWDPYEEKCTKQKLKTDCKEDEEYHELKKKNM